MKILLILLKAISCLSNAQFPFLYKLGSTGKSFSERITGREVIAKRNSMPGVHSDLCGAGAEFLFWEEILQFCSKPQDGDVGLRLPGTSQCSASSLHNFKSFS